MKTKHIITALIFGILFVACKQEKKGPLLQEYLVGNWETTYLKIEYLTANETDSTSVFEDDFSKPNSGKAQSTYNSDGTFSAWFVQADGKKVGETNGKWKTSRDSLFVDYPYLGKQVQAWYKITQTNNGFSATSTYDWDNDGEIDDTLLMRTKKIEL
ncbi:hypothetical protein KUL156_17870 [Alteromonas sp. KUL156]|uniref:hypothetical protein n=1 Tax=Tenacibaculum sp. XPcli2-G TaxID=2954503 RepID=UPI0012E6D55E|nr:hypothetical protein [Tenacibaculum sp. XPcli2-G]MCO7184310.1 hypothetical protein [Tenacibaculum sp. XPcli2-G]GFD99194.1 hypothetical protein KUL156_17870 [Alteromonas sp. KUL156]